MLMDNIKQFSSQLDRPENHSIEGIKTRFLLTLQVPSTPNGRIGRPLKPNFLLIPNFEYA